MTRKPLSRKQRRLLMLGACGLCLAGAVGLALSALSDNVTFFVSPSEIATKAPAPGRSFRLGGLVENGSVRKTQADGKAGIGHAPGQQGGAAEMADAQQVLDVKQDPQRHRRARGML